ncbi:MAG TPA: hypothetical protein VN976_03250 [Verrucomicrobiae bacterium]|nr:hypothetical protein [Verrucomicrobiae bacterium]
MREIGRCVHFAQGTPLVHLTRLDVDITKTLLVWFFLRWLAGREHDSQMNYESISLWVAVASLALSVAACLIAWSSLRQAKQVAERDRKDWKQRKWFDLYFAASGVYDDLDRFQGQYVFTRTGAGVQSVPGQRNTDLSDLMASIRKVHAMAAVFPKTQAITDLFNATAAFKETDKEVTSRDRLKKIGDAVEGLRQQALLVDKSVLE